MLATFAWPEFWAGILVGILGGAGGGYVSARLVSWREKHDAAAAESKRFKEAQKQMPELIAEMKEDLSSPENSSCREIMILPTRTTRVGRAAPRLIYSEAEHENLRNKLKILENHGFIHDETTGRAPIYRMTETFVALVLSN